MRKNLLSALHFGSSLVVVGLLYSACSTKPAGLMVKPGDTTTGATSSTTNNTSGNGTVSGAGASNWWRREQ